MRRTAMVLVLFALAPFLMGAGGPFTSIPANYVLSSDAISAFIVIDTHNAGATTTAKLASITLRDTTHSPSQPQYAQGSFNIPADFPFGFGCDPTKTEVRFVGNTGTRVPFDAWMPEEFMKALFRQLGRTVTASPGTNTPVITRVFNGGSAGQCMDDPRNLTTNDASIPGWLFLEAEVRFAGPPKK